MRGYRWRPMAAAEVPATTTLTALEGGETRTIDEWLITFQLLGVVLDPFTYESSWIIDTAIRIFRVFQDCLLYTSPSPRDGLLSRMPSSA